MRNGTSNPKTVSAREKRNELKKLAKQARTGIYDMLRLADELLADHAYVDANGGEQVLIESLEADEFSHFGGAPSLKQLLRAYRQNPKRAVWEEYHFNVWSMIELATPAKEGDPKQRINWKALAKELEARLKNTEATLIEVRQSNVSLRARLDQLTAENGELKGRLQATEKFAMGGKV